MSRRRLPQLPPRANGSSQPGFIVEGVFFGTAVVIFLIMLMLMFVFVNKNAQTTGENVAGSDRFGDAARGQCPDDSLQKIRVNRQILDRISANRRVYELAASENSLPWEMLAAVHYREHSNDPSSPNPEGPFQLTSYSDELNAGRVPTYKGRPVTRADITGFTTSAKLAADILQAKVSRRLTPEPDDSLVMDALFRYNGTSYGSADRSPYVMNNFDLNHQNMRIRGKLYGGGQVDTIDTRDGAFTVYYLLRYLAIYDSNGKITGFRDCVSTDAAGSAVIVGSKACPAPGGSAGWGSVRRSNPHEPTYPGHEGLDIFGDRGTSIFAVVGGSVIEAGGSLGSGYRVWIDDGQGHYWFYQHMTSEVEVEKGQAIAAGALVGHMSDSGAQTRPVHLHLGIAKRARSATSGARIRWDLWHYPYDFLYDIPCLKANSS